MITPLSNGFRRYITSLSRRLGLTHSRRSPRRGVWLVGLVIFLTSVTIAAIIPRGVDTPPATILAPSAAPQTVRVSDTVLPCSTDDMTRPSPIAEMPKSAPADRDVWTEIRIRKGDTLSDILKQEGYDSNEITRAIQSNPKARVFRKLQPGKRYGYVPTPDSPGRNSSMKPAPERRFISSAARTGSSSPKRYAPSRRASPVSPGPSKPPCSRTVRKRGFRTRWP